MELSLSQISQLELLFDEILYLEGHGFDVGSYADVAFRYIDCNMLCFNTSTTCATGAFIESAFSVLENKGVGLVGATGSFASIRNSQYFWRLTRLAALQKRGLDTIVNSGKLLASSFLIVFVLVSTVFPTHISEQMVLVLGAATIAVLLPDKNSLPNETAICLSQALKDYLPLC